MDSGVVDSGVVDAGGKGSYRAGGVILERRSPSCRRWHTALLFEFTRRRSRGFVAAGVALGRSGVAQPAGRRRRGSYRGKRRRVTQRFRLIGINHPLTGVYHAHFGAQAIAQLYSARWLVELVFRQLRSYLQLESFPSRNPHIVHALIYSAVLTMIVSRHIEQVLYQRDRTQPLLVEPVVEDLSPLLRPAAVLQAWSMPATQSGTEKP